MDMPRDTDLFVIGGGINGVGVACDAAGRGVNVVLCEQGDLASATSSASSKLVHGGLRYLEHYEFRLVREALTERRLLLDKAPHLVSPLSFVFPHKPSMRPAWMMRLGLFLYDRLAKFDPRLPRSVCLDLENDEALNGTLKTGFAYSDCQVDDARLVVANALHATQHGARIFTHMQVTNAVREKDRWQVTVQCLDTKKMHTVRARALVNAAGPWALDVLKICHGNVVGKQLRLVKGSHIVVKRLYDGDQAYILQNDDERVVFVIPYQRDFTLIGTTEVHQDTPPNGGLDISSAEATYLCQSVNAYFKSQIQPTDAVQSFAGVRPLFDDKATHFSKVTREYVLDLDVLDGAPVLSIFGGKLTTYRRLSEKVLNRLSPYFPNSGPAWTATAVLPGGEGGTLNAPDIDKIVREGLTHRHGAWASRVLSGATTMADLGKHFGWGLTALEVDYMIKHEWARNAEDILWRRSKLGLYFDPAQVEALTAYCLHIKEKS